MDEATAITEAFRKHILQTAWVFSNQLTYAGLMEVCRFPIKSFEQEEITDMFEQETGTSTPTTIGGVPVSYRELLRHDVEARLWYLFYHSLMEKGE